MAGSTNPLVDLFTRKGGLDADRYGVLAEGVGYSDEAEQMAKLERRKRRREGFASFINDIERLKQQRAATEQAAAMQQGLGLPPVAEAPGMGDVRKAEQQQADETTPLTIEDANKTLAQRREEAAQGRAMLAAYEKETAALDPRRFAPEIKQRVAAIETSRKELDDFEAKLAEFAGQIATESAQGRAPEQGWLARTIGVGKDVDAALSENPLSSAPYRGVKSLAGGIVDLLAGGQEAVAGIGSLAAEGLDKITPGSNKFATGAPIGITDLLPGPLGFSEEGALRRRGREFNEKVGRALGYAEKKVEDAPVLGAAYRLGFKSNVGEGARQLANMGGMNISEDQAREMGNSMLFSIATDPLNVVDAGGGVTQGIRQAYNAGKASKAGAALIEKAPWLLKPERFWLRMQGKFIEAKILNTPLEPVYAAQQAFAKRVDGEALRIKRDTMQSAARLMNGLREEQRARILGVVPKLVERGSGARAAAKLGLADVSYKPLRELEPIERKIALDYADLVENYNVIIKNWENANGLRIHDLEEEFNYLGHEFSDEMQAEMAKRADMREGIFKRKGMFSLGEMKYANANPEMARTLRGMEFEDAAKWMREKYGLPKDFKIWRNDHLEQIGDRAVRSAYKAKRRHLASMFAENFGEKLDDVGVRAMMDDLDPTGAVRLSESFRHMSPQEQAEVMRGAVDAAAGQSKAEELRKAAVGLKESFDTAEQTAAAAKAGFTGTAETAAQAEKRAQQARAYYRATEGSAEAAKAKHKAAYDEYFKAQDEFNKAGAATANDRMKRAVADLKAAKAAMAGASESDPAARAAAQKVVDEAEAAYKSAKEASEQAQETFAKAQKTFREKEAAWREAETAYQTAEKAAGDARKAVMGANYPKPGESPSEALKRLQGTGWNALSPTGKAREVLNLLEKRGALHPQSALKIMLEGKSNLPGTFDELVRLGTTRIDPADANLMREFASDMDPYNHLIGPGDDAFTKAGKYYDGVVRIYQKSVLGRLSSLSKDAIGTMIHGAMMDNNLRYLPEAEKALGGFQAWRKGSLNVPDWVLQLKAEGVLKTTLGEALDRPGVFEAIKNPALRKTLSTVDKRGMLGALAGGGLKGKLGTVGRAVSAVTDNINDARVYLEELNRAASYLKHVKAGLGHDEAVMRVMAQWGDFSQVSQLNRRLLGRVQFFLQWRLRSIPITLKAWLDKPARSRWLLALMAGNAGEDDRAPDWLVRQGGQVLGLNDKGDLVALGMGGGSYFSPTIALAQSDMVRHTLNGDPGAAIKGAGMDFLRGTPPFIQEPLGAMMGVDVFTGKPVRDPDTGQSAVRAPWVLYQLRNTAIGRWFNVRENARDGQVRSATMDPLKATLLGLVPGLEPAMADAGSFVDPRASDVDPNVSLAKGALRQLGLPVYHMPPEDARMRALRAAGTALHASVDSLSGHALTVIHGQVVPSNQTERGQAMLADRARWESEAKQAGKGAKEAAVYVTQMTLDKYPEEGQLMQLDAWMRRQRAELEGGNVGLNKADAKYKPLGLNKRMSDQDLKELKRRQDAAERAAYGRLPGRR